MKLKCKGTHYKGERRFSPKNAGEYTTNRPFEAGGMHL